MQRSQYDCIWCAQIAFCSKTLHLSTLADAYENLLLLNLDVLILHHSKICKILQSQKGYVFVYFLVEKKHPKGLAPRASLWPPLAHEARNMKRQPQFPHSNHTFFRSKRLNWNFPVGYPSRFSPCFLAREWCVKWIKKQITYFAHLALPAEQGTVNMFECTHFELYLGGLRSTSQPMHPPCPCVLSAGSKWTWKRTERQGD